MFGFATQSPTLQKNSALSTILLFLLGVAGVSMLTYLVTVGEVRIAITATIALLLVMMAVIRIQVAIVGLLAFIVFMGDLRRLLIPMVGWSGTDPLLLIGPTFAIAMFGYAWASRSISLDTPLSISIAALMVVMVLQMFNPRQGGLMVGVAGSLFMLIPLLWYWIGRTYATPSFVRTLFFRVIVPLSIIAALMGYYQTFYGYLPYQQQWYDIAGFIGLGSEGIQAPISLFASPTEYANFLLIAMVILWGLFLEKRNPALLLLIPFLFLAVFFTGSRGPIVKFVFTAAGMWAILANTKSQWVTRGVVAVVLGMVVVGWSLSSIGDVGGNARVQHRFQRQADGLTNPLQHSSTRTHLGMMVHGLVRGVTTPLGLGLGATTKAASKFGSGGTGSTETDIGDVFVSTGLFGGILYLVIIFLTLRTVLRYWTASRSLYALCFAGILAVVFFLWLRGGQYSTSPLVWLCVGALDSFYHQHELAQDDSLAEPTVSSSS